MSVSHSQHCLAPIATIDKSCSSTVSRFESTHYLDILNSAISITFCSPARSRSHHTSLLNSLHSRTINTSCSMTPSRLYHAPNIFSLTRTIIAPSCSVIKSRLKLFYHLDSFSQTNANKCCSLQASRYYLTHWPDSSSLTMTSMFWYQHHYFFFLLPTSSHPTTIAPTNIAQPTPLRFDVTQHIVVLSHTITDVSWSHSLTHCPLRYQYISFSSRNESIIHLPTLLFATHLPVSLPFTDTSPYHSPTYLPPTQPPMLLPHSKPFCSYISIKYSSLTLPRFNYIIASDFILRYGQVLLLQIDHFLDIETYCLHTPTIFVHAQ